MDSIEKLKYLEQKERELELDYLALEDKLETAKSTLFNVIYSTRNAEDLNKLEFALDKFKELQKQKDVAEKLHVETMDALADISKIINATIGAIEEVAIKKVITSKITMPISDRNTITFSKEI